MELKNRKLANYGRRYFKEFALAITDGFTEICSDPDYDIDGASEIYKYASTISWVADEANTVPVSDFACYLSERTPNGFECRLKDKPFLFLPLRLGKYMGRIRVKSSSPAHSISSLCKADGDGIIILGEHKDLCAIFDFDFESNSISTIII